VGHLYTSYLRRAAFRSPSERFCLMALQSGGYLHLKEQIWFADSSTTVGGVV